MARNETWENAPESYEVDTAPASEITDYLDNMDPEDRALMGLMSDAIDLGGENFLDMILDRVNTKEISIPTAIIVPVQAVESTGHNKIPLMISAVIESRTGKPAAQRVANRPVFVGEVKQGQEYILVDDHVTQGGTLAALRDYITANGGVVVGSTTLTASQESNILSLTVETKQKLHDKFGANKLSVFLNGHQNAASSTENLTESEARYTLKWGTLDSLRKRLTSEGYEEKPGLGQKAESASEVNETGETNGNTGGIQSDLFAPADSPITQGEKPRVKLVLPSNR